MSRRPPWASLRSGSMRWARSPWRACRWTTDSCSSASRVRALARQSCATVERAALTTSASPATCVRSSRPTAAERSSEATVRHWRRCGRCGRAAPRRPRSGTRAGRRRRRPPCRTRPRGWCSEHEVVVAEGAAVAAGEAAHRGEGDALVAPAGAGLAPQLLKPPEAELRERPAAGLARRRASRRSGCRRGPDVVRSHPSCQISPSPGSCCRRSSSGASALRERRRRARRCGPAPPRRPGRTRSCRHRCARSGRP